MLYPLHITPRNRERYGGQSVSDQNVRGFCRWASHGPDVLADKRHPGRELPERPLHRLIGTRGVGEDFGRYGFELRLIAAAHQLRSHC